MAVLVLYVAVNGLRNKEIEAAYTSDIKEILIRVKESTGRKLFKNENIRKQLEIYNLNDKIEEYWKK